jgi:RNA polymerase sigma-70 factor (ECF subfamily)
MTTPLSPFTPTAPSFEKYRPYLSMLARSNVAPRNRARIDPSGLVQQTLLHAVERQAQLRGQSEGEVMAWLKQILAHQLADALRGLARAKRDVSREQSLDQIADSFSRVDGWLVSMQPSPSQQAVRSEELFHMATALNQLSELQRDAIVMHHLQGLPLAEVCEHLNKTPGAVAGLLHRGLKQLRELMAADKSVSNSTNV